MDAETSRGVGAANIREPAAPSGRVTPGVAKKFLNVSPRTVRWHIEQGNVEAKPQGEGVQRTWLVSIDSLQAFRRARQISTNLPGSIRTDAEDAAIGADIAGSPVRELADRLAEEAARAAEYRVRLELTEQAQSTLEEQLAMERQRREQAERECDELRLKLERPPEPRDVPETVPEGTVRGEVPPEAQEATQRRSWLYRFFFGP